MKEFSQGMKEVTHQAPDIPIFFFFYSLAPERFEQNFRWLIFKLISVTDGWGISCKIALRWMPLDLTDDESTLVQVMAWCCQATSHYLSQCWPRFMSPYGVTRSQWVNLTWLTKCHSSKLIQKFLPISICSTSSFTCRRMLSNGTWDGSWRCNCLVSWFCYQLIAKSGNKTAMAPCLDPCMEP